MPDRFIRRSIRGMLPYKQEKGEKAFKKIMCHIGVPEKFSKEKIETIPSSSITKSKTFKYISVGKLCQLLKKWKQYIRVERERHQ